MEGAVSRESAILSHQACPDCGSSDGLSVYSDHTYCFVCQQRKPRDGELVTTKSKKPTKLLRPEYEDIPERKLSEEACQRMKYGLARDPRGNLVHVAEFWNPATRRFTGQKWRYPDKTFKVVGEISDCLFGAHLVPDGGKRIVITEGEIDAVSYNEVMKGWPVVSVPNGSGSAKKSLTHHLEWLERFDEVVLAFDNDEPGNKAMLDCVDLFTPGKVRIAQLDPTYKDFNDALLRDDHKAILNAVFNARSYTPDGIVNSLDAAAKLLEPAPKADAHYPFPKLNAKLQGLRLGELVTICAGSGVGKSLVCREVAYSLGVEQGHKVGMLFLEETTRRTALGLLSIATNKPLHIDESVLKNDARDRKIAHVFGSDRFVFLDHFGSYEIDKLCARIRFMAAGLGCKFVILDHISIALSGLELNDERKAIDVAVTKLRTLVNALNIGLICVSHLKRPFGKKGHEEGTIPSLSHLRGSHGIAQLSDIVLGVARNTQSALAKNHAEVYVLKNRFTGEVGFATSMSYNPKTGRIKETDLEAVLDSDQDDEKDF